MTLYLQVASTNKITTPSFSFTDVKLDMEIDVGNTGVNLTGLYTNFNNQLAFGTNLRQATGATATINGGSPIAYNTNISSYFGQRILLDISTINTINANGGYVGGFTGRLYDVKYYNGATLVAHYDMSTGTVQDVSGNGNHATLTGGTWVDDGAGGGTTLTVSLSDSVTLSELITKSPSKRLSDSITLSDTLSKSLTVTVVDTVSIGDSSTASQGGKSALLNDTVIVTDAIVKKVISTLKTDVVNLSDVDEHTATKQLFDNITLTDTISKSNGKSIILSDSITVTDAIFKAVSVMKSDSITLTDSTEKTAKIGVYDVVITADELNILNPQAPQIIGAIHLKGSQTLNVYLVGSQILNVNLKGGI